MTIEQPLSDFFTAGGTLPPDAPSYVKRPTDDELFRHITAGEFCYVLTPRQMGKSSLMIRTAQRLSNAGVKSAVIDLTQIGTVDSEDQWYKGILTQIKRRLKLTIDPVTWWEQKQDIPNIQKFIEFFEEMLSEIKERVVIFMDEIDTTLKLDFRDDFFAGIRAMFNARAENPDLMRITFVLLGVASPSDLIKDRSRTPFNIGQEIPLRSFSREDARMLEKGLEEVYPNHGKEILDRVFYWTNGHPYLTQKLCQSIVESRFKRYDDKDIDSLVKKLFTSEEASRETNLQFVRDNVLSYPERRVILSLYKKLLRGSQVPDNKNSLPQNHLKLSGLARVEGGKLVVGNKIYGTVFNQRWVRRYTDVDWRYPIIGFLSLVILGFSFVFYNDGVRLPNQAATRVNGISIYRDDRGIQYLADLFRMKPYIFPNEYEYKAKDVFFNSFSNWEEQKALIEIGYGEPHPPPEDYEVVVTGLYTSLADVDGSGDTTRLLEIMYKSLEEMKMQEEGIYQEIGYWLDARKNINENNFENALTNYNFAIELNDKNPATLFERARVYTRLDKFESALNDYEQVVAIVPESNTEPTEIPPTSRPRVTRISSQLSNPTLAPTLDLFVSTAAIAPEVIIPTADIPTNTPFIVTTASQVPLSLSPVQPKFLTLGQRINAVKHDLSQNENFDLMLSQIGLSNFTNLSRYGLAPTPTIKSKYTPGLTPTYTLTWTAVGALPNATIIGIPTTLNVPTKSLPETSNFLIIYDDISAYLINISQNNVSLGGIEFRRIDDQGSITASFLSDTWRSYISNGYFDALPPNDCLGINTQRSLRPSECEDTWGFFTTSQTQYQFWIATSDSQQFQVWKDNILLQTCEISARSCQFNLPLTVSTATKPIIPTHTLTVPVATRTVIPARTITATKTVTPTRTQTPIPFPTLTPIAPSNTLYPEVLYITNIQNGQVLNCNSAQECIIDVSIQWAPDTQAQGRNLSVWVRPMPELPDGSGWDYFSQNPPHYQSNGIWRVINCYIGQIGDKTGMNFAIYAIVTNEFYDAGFSSVSLPPSQLVASVVVMR